jgi:hypothetical protein
MQACECGLHASAGAAAEREARAGEGWLSAHQGLTGLVEVLLLEVGTYHSVVQLLPL